jgi:macrolide-specific efflux system membrane fusion protein
VPTAALRQVRRGEGRGTYIARVIKDDGSIEERQVTVGVTNRVSAEIKSGLSAGEKVVLPTAGGLRPGQPQQRPQQTRTPRLS